MTLTPRQFEILHAIREYRMANQFSPTLQEIANEWSISRVAVFEHLAELESKKFITRAKRKSRSIELTRAGEMVFKPLATVGQVTLWGILKKYGIDSGVSVQILRDVAIAGK